MKHLFFSLLMFVASVGLAAADDGVDFAKQIAPILERHCLRCHSGDEPKGGLSLRTHALTLAGGDSGPSVVGGKSGESPLIEQISGAEPAMPKSAPPLAAEQIALIARWIDSGAIWPDGLELKNPQRADASWWALQKVVRPQPPQVKRADWVANEIDAFILASLEQQQLSPAAPADKTTLLRRVTFDLTGLPPTPDEVANFLADESPRAFEKIVDQLLASPRYGERWARHWLDVAHYADTHGFESDGKRANAWRYRDYVIDAFNRDKPYRDFIREQIAADVIAGDDPDKVAAIGFLGTGPWDKIGHETLAKELRRKARADELDDIVTTVIASTMGLTINCARCHDHKFDPILQADYYKLSAVFAGVRHGDRPMLGADAEKRRAADKLALQQQLSGVLTELALLEHKPIELADVVSGGNGFGGGSPDRGIDPRNGEPSTGKIGVLTGIEPNRFVRSKVSFVDGVVIPDATKGPTPITSTGITVELPGADGQSWDYIQRTPVLSQDTSTLGGIDYSAAGRTMISLHANKALTFDLSAVRAAHPSFQSLKLQAVAGYGGKGAGASADFAILVDGQQRAGQRKIDLATGPVAIEIPLAAADRFLTLVATSGGNGISYDQVFFGDPRLVNTAAPDEASAPKIAALGKQRDELTAKIAAIAAPPSVYAVVGGAPPPTFIFKRGDSESPGEQVGPGAFAFIKHQPPDFDASSDEGARPVALANWITDAANPLTARVLVNRLWHYHFGAGIVNTPSDFGFNGDRPSHAELLDWLADEFVARGGSIKAMHRLMVLSNTYRQASISAKPAEKDSGNRLLWRANRRRLEAEAMRDAILAVSGKLNLAMGGPGYQDFEYIEKYAPVYKFITADKPELWRRTVYRFTVRSVPQDFMEALDCPNPSILAPSRNRTTTALQALALLNNPFVISQAEYFAERVKHEAGDDGAVRVERAYRLAFGRAPTASERERALALVGKHGLVPLCHALFNASEFMYID